MTEITSDIAELRYLEEPGSDYPRVIRVKTHGPAGMFQLRTFLERLATGQTRAVDVLSEMPAVSQRVSHCVWHIAAEPVQHSVTLIALADSHLSVDWYADPSRWREQLEVFDDYLAQMGKPLVIRSEIIESAARIACLCADPETDYDAVFEAEL